MTSFGNIKQCLNHTQCDYLTFLLSIFSNYFLSNLNPSLHPFPPDLAGDQLQSFLRIPFRHQNNRTPAGKTRKEYVVTPRDVEQRNWCDHNRARRRKRKIRRTIVREGGGKRRGGGSGENGEGERLSISSEDLPKTSHLNLIGDASIVGTEIDRRLVPIQISSHCQDMVHP